MRRISLLFGSLVLSACTHQGYTPDDEDMSIPKNWTEEDNLYTNSETDLLCLPWWQQFKDAPGMRSLMRVYFITIRYKWLWPILKRLKVN